MRNLLTIVALNALLAVGVGATNNRMHLGGDGPVFLISVDSRAASWDTTIYVNTTERHVSDSLKYSYAAPQQIIIAFGCLTAATVVDSLPYCIVRALDAENYGYDLMTGDSLMIRSGSNSLGGAGVQTWRADLVLIHNVEHRYSIYVRNPMRGTAIQKVRLWWTSRQE